MVTKEELKTRLVTGHKVTQQDMSDIVDVAGSKGATGNTGPAGKDGQQGVPGTNGKDGFGTKAEYDAIIARLEALETS